MGVSDNLDSLCTINYDDVIMDLEMMRVATPHIGVEPCAGPKTDVMGLVCIRIRKSPGDDAEIHSCNFEDSFFVF